MLKVGAGLVFEAKFLVDFVHIHKSVVICDFVHVGTYLYDEIHVLLQLMICPHTPLGTAK